jgi:hypothetical protein
MGVSGAARGGSGSAAVRHALKSPSCVTGDGFMLRKVLIALGVLAAAGVLAFGNMALANGGRFAGPGIGITGNDTGGIFPYSPADEGSFQLIADGHCARYGRMAKVTSVHHLYGDYISFVCYDRPGRIH